MAGRIPDHGLCAVPYAAARREAVQAATLPGLAKGQAQLEDLPALVTLGKFICGIKQLPIRHVVVDECQDFSPYQVQLLRELTDQRLLYAGGRSDAGRA